VKGETLKLQRDNGTRVLHQIMYEGWNETHKYIGNKCFIIFLYYSYIHSNINGNDIQNDA